MSDDRSSDGLPTAAILDLTRLPRTEDGEFTGFYESSSVLIPEIERVEDEDELVRRKDHIEDKEKALEEQREEFKVLIQDKIEEEKVEEEGYVNFVVKALEELLDEVHEAV